ncbi:hypothetical protein Rumeso_04832 [Rubellimicrobium mesophilum DSM 19309]|uniref:Alkaline phosphatase n=1 Tax=Rubellimicrobium mesophilum DSM 19309 TaxID=442562 RepID=A0A017HCM9_9RHOB|nr:calcium-binding protein [Rubellimicrobium mesophilum]EYD72126.1 hypothetical protein Rumeso_04832 [Rubellimicrobium mesophilum DSM 19309]
MIPVLIEQLVPNLDILTPTDARSGALLGKVATGFAWPGSTAVAATIDDPWDNRFDVFVAGQNLTYDVNGQLRGGTITAITILSPQGIALASLANAVPGGLALDVAGLRAARNSPEALDALVAHWDITYSAAKVTSPGATIDGGVTFEGARGTDSLTGTQWADHLSGAGGHDVLWGGAGDDWLHGDDTKHVLSDAPTGNDTLSGGLGSDWLFGDAGDDDLRGGDGSDMLRGDEWGQSGNDRLDGGAGADRFFSEAGNDTYLGGAGRDTLTILDDLSVPLVTLDLTAHAMTGYGSDTVSGIEIVEGSYESRNALRGSDAAESFSGSWHEDILKGEGGADRLWGDWGNDEVRGGAGNDLLGGDAGLDTIYGGAGRDSFYFTDAAGDRVEDFLAADDQVWLAQGLVPGLANGPLASAAFKDLSVGKVDSSDRLLYDRASGKLWIDADGSGAAVRQLLAQLDPGTALSAADIEVRPTWDRDDFLV